MTNMHARRAKPTIGISTFVPSLATTVKVAKAADRVGCTPHGPASSTPFRDRRPRRDGPPHQLISDRQLRRLRRRPLTADPRQRSTQPRRALRRPPRPRPRHRHQRHAEGLARRTGSRGARDAPGRLVPLLRKIWKLHEGPVKHDGRFYSINVIATAEVPPPVRERIPVTTAGVNRRMIETAGRVTDGLICHPTFTSRYIEDVVRPAIARGAHHTSRDPNAVEIVGMLMSSVNNDEELARREVAAQIAFYTAPKAYAPMLEASGFAAEGERTRAAFAASDNEAMIAAVSDEMIDAIAVAGTGEHVRAGINRRAHDFDHLALYSPSFTMTPQRIRHNLLDLVKVGASVTNA